VFTPFFGSATLVVIPATFLTTRDKGTFIQIHVHIVCVSLWRGKKLVLLHQDRPVMKKRCIHYGMKNKTEYVPYFQWW
jgi:hypothetical protein